MAEVVAIIPARGGSKGIPRKNLVLFNGLPLIVHSIQHGLSSKLINRVIVSTEDKEIAEISKKYGAEIYQRPISLAKDNILDWPVFNSVLNELIKEGYFPDIIVHLRPTSPHREISWIDEAIQLLIDNSKADSVRSVSPPLQHPYRMFRIDTDGYLDPIMKQQHQEPYLLRRQDLPLFYYYNCVIDVTRSKTILIKKSMTGDKMLPYVMNADDVIDIDSPRDLKIAKVLFEDKIL